ncbi:MAG: type I restriction endonuclease subunit R [Kineosporiaceae bacterium]|nr:type I restriction endonuclease subunit R [Kineosporiaceae bacterium]
MASEADWEIVTLEAVGEHGWKPLAGSEIAPGTARGRTSWGDLVLPDRTLAVMRALNPMVPRQYLEQALGEILTPSSQDAVTENFRLHRILVEGYRGIAYLDSDGIEQNPTIHLVSHIVENNEFLAANQVTLRSREHERRLDVVLYLNGLPVVIVELKKAGSARATIGSAHSQLATYLAEFPMAFRCCVLTVISDGITARYGTPFTPLNHYAPWNVDDDGHPLPQNGVETDPHDPRIGVPLEFLLDGVGNPERFLQLLRNFVAFDAGAEGLTKRIAKPHQYFAVTKAVGHTVEAAESDGKAGVVWHTQGSGKSMEMELYAHAVTQQAKLKNPTLVLVTDRTDLDTQLWEAFERSQLVGQPLKVTSRDDLRRELNDRITGGIYFTTLQKFSLTQAEKQAGRDHPLLSQRRNIIVIVDEAHRSHYDQLDGYAKHIRSALPHATFIAFTGTPISFADRDTVDVFGDVIDTYDLSRAVTDGATVRVFFEQRIIQVARAGEVTEEQLDAAADEATAGLDDVERDRIETSVAVINAMYGVPERIAELARDILEHWDRRSAAMRPFIECTGKAFIVGATREICARIYEQIIALRPDWHDDAIDRGKIKVVYSGSASDQPPISKHVRRQSLNETIQNRIKDPDDPLEIVIVKDMLLTGFDAPPLHTLYLDRPQQGAQLMQTLARVNRTFRGKTDGLLVAYAPLADNLTRALAEYTANDQARRPVGRDVAEAAAAAREHLEALDELCSGFPWRDRIADAGTRTWLKTVLGLTQHLRAPATPGNQDDPTLADRFRQLAARLARLWALATGDDTAKELTRDVRFYEEVRVWMAKFDAQERQASGQAVPDDVRRLLSQLIATSTTTGEIIDIYEAAGIPKPSLTDLNPELVQRLQNAERPHLAIEALRDLLTSEAGAVTRHNLTRQRAFSQRLRELMNRYTNQQLTSAEVIAELIELAREVARESQRGKDFQPPLSHDELAFYDAVSTNASAVEVQGEAVLAQIARELVAIMQRDVKTDWRVRDDVRAKLRSSIKRLLVKYRYPPDRQPDAIRLVIEQMEAMAPRYAS